MQVHVDRKFLAMFAGFGGPMLLITCLMFGAVSQIEGSGLWTGLQRGFQRTCIVCLLAGLAFACGMTLVETVIDRYPKSRHILLSLLVVLCAIFVVFRHR